MAWVSSFDGPQLVHKPTIRSHIVPEELLSSQLYDLDPDVNVPELLLTMLLVLKPVTTDE